MTSEEAVRQYLMYLHNPESLRDEDKIREAELAVEQAGDPLEKLKAYADLRFAQDIDGDEYRTAFTAHAKAYAEAEDIPVDAFLDMGVPEQDLQAAGFDVGSRSAGSQGSGRSRVSSADVQSAALSFATPFTVAELEERTGASIGTVRKVIGDLVGDGRLSEQGEDPDWSGRGRAPMRYASA